MRLLWLAQVLADANLSVVPHDGWQNRGRELQSVNGIVCHHTATGTNWSDQRVVELLIKGRSDLPGPLCQLGLDRKGRFHVIAAGKGNHNGFGTWGNQSLGIEAFNDGMGEVWPAEQINAYQRGCAAICQHLGWDQTKVLGHKETDPGRKVDPRGIDMDDFRARVAAHLNPDEEEDMAARVIRIPDGRLFGVDTRGITAKHIPDKPTYDALVREKFVVPESEIEDVSWESAVWLDIPDR